MPDVSCEHGKTAPLEVLENLAESQTKSGGQKCLICAYQCGYAWGVEHKFMLTGDVWDFKMCKHGSRANSKTLLELPDDQAGIGNQKCATCAYNRGFEDGKAFSNPTAH